MPDFDPITTTSQKITDNSDNSDANWEYTRLAGDFTAMRQRAERKLGRDARHTIGRDARIDGGVYEGSYGGEAIVIDRDKYPEVNRALEHILAKVALSNGSIKKSAVLKAVFDYVGATMHYDEQAVDSIFKTQLSGRDGTKIALDTYIKYGVGVCRHQALYVGALLEALADHKLIGGKVSVDRNMVRADGDNYDGHAWARYTNSAGQVYILDVAQQRIDSLDNLMAERRALGPDRVWDYARPEDHEKARGRLALSAADPEQEWRQFSTGQQSRVEYDDNDLIKLPDWVKNQNQ